jgi:hypothetical protein
MSDAFSAKSGHSLFQPLKGTAAGMLLSAGLMSTAFASPLATTTKLSIPEPSVARGVPTLLEATVTDASKHTVLAGTVEFYTDGKPLGTAQIVSRTGGSFTQGTASLKTASFPYGKNSITAAYLGTTADLPSTSPAVTVRVTSKAETLTGLTSSVQNGENILTATVDAFRGGVPTGSVDFEDVTSGASLGTVPLSGALWKSRLLLGSSPQVGGAPGGVAAGDFNGDGRLDLATANNDGGISVLIGKGDGTFHPQVVYGAGSFPANIYAGDFNNDGKLDLAVVNYDDGAVGVLLGNGDGTFQPQTEYGSVGGAVDAKIADFNNDGNLDFVVSDRFGNDVAVLLGNGDGTFQPQRTFSTGDGPWSPVVGDVNGDGILDILVTAGGEVSELIGKGDGTFKPYTVLAIGASGNGPYITLGDLNRDGKLDIVEGNNGLNTVTVALGKGDGTFESALTYHVGGAPGQPVIFDFNQDGIPDIAVTNWNTNDIELLLGRGDGTFDEPITLYKAAEVPNFMITGDLNGDGRTDLIATTSVGSEETVLLSYQGASVQLTPSVTGSTLGASRLFRR